MFLKQIKKTIIFCIFCSIILANNLTMSIPKVKIKNNYLYVSSKLINGFTQEVEEALYTGIEVNINIIIELVQKQQILFFMDKTIKSIKITHKVIYDALEKKYIVFLSEKGFFKVETMDEVKKIVFKIENIELIIIDKLEKENYYYVQVQAQVKSIELYPPLSYIINIFTPFWNYKTNWIKTTQFTVNQ